jgi:hypothetical protein
MIELISKALEIVLNNNYFQACGTTFLQKIGTAMGTPAAVVFANIFMFMLERPVLARHKALILYYKRLLDDIFIIVKEGSMNLETIRHSLNVMHPAIKLEFSSSATSVDFLDITIFKGPNFSESGLLSTTVHQKLLNAYLYIPFCSFHSPKAKGAFIITELMRYIRLCSDRKDYIGIKNLFFQRLRARGYPAKFLDSFMNRVQYADRQKFLESKVMSKSIRPHHSLNTSQSTPEVYFTCPWDPLTQRLPFRRILKQYRTEDVDIEPMVGFKRTPNLLEILKTKRPSESARANSTPTQRN